MLFHDEVDLIRLVGHKETLITQLIRHLTAAAATAAATTLAFALTTAVVCL